MPTPMSGPTQCTRGGAYTPNFTVLILHLITLCMHIPFLAVTTTELVTDFRSTCVSKQQLDKVCLTCKVKQGRKRRGRLGRSILNTKLITSGHGQGTGNLQVLRSREITKEYERCLGTTSGIRYG